MSIESRIIAVADVYGALSEDRPYRPSVQYNKIVGIMNKLAPQKLDGDCVATLLGLIAEEQDLEFKPVEPLAGVALACA
jgi:HD-GYP domain-containing protein (c-di-GMP phosphodiesterase class II)